MKEAMAPNVEGRGLARSDAIDHGRGRLDWGLGQSEHVAILGERRGGAIAG